MRFKLFGFLVPAQYALLPAAGLVAAVLGGITASALGAIGLGLLFALVYTIVENGVFRQGLFGKIGSGPLAWFGVQSLGEFIAYFGGAWLLGHFFGVHIASWLGWVVFIGVGVVILQDTFRTFLLNIALWMQFRNQR